MNLSLTELIHPTKTRVKDLKTKRYKTVEKENEKGKFFKTPKLELIYDLSLPTGKDDKSEVPSYIQVGAGKFLSSLSMLLSQSTSSHFEIYTMGTISFPASENDIGVKKGGNVNWTTGANQCVYSRYGMDIMIQYTVAKSLDPDEENGLPGPEWESRYIKTGVSIQPSRWTRFELSFNFEVYSWMSQEESDTTSFGDSINLQGSFLIAPNIMLGMSINKSLDISKALDGGLGVSYMF